LERCSAAVEHIPYPYAYRCELGHTKETCGGEIIELLEQQSSSGYSRRKKLRRSLWSQCRAKARFIPAPLFFLQELQRICNKHRHHADPG